MDTTKQKPLTLSPTRTSCNSPEFEFWMLRNPSFPQPNLLTADELFVDGVLLPLHLLPTTNKTDPPPQTPNSDSSPHNQDPDPEPEPESQPDSSPAITESSSSTFSASKRWKDIFRKGEKNNTEEKEKEKEKKNKEKKKERKNGNGGASSAAELNINIWPFSRSRSAGNTTTRPKFFPGAPTTRKVNSAPCSRSNSAGESKSRKWPNSPGRAGVHVGRNSPVWQVRRGGAKNSEQQTQQGSNTEKELKKETATVSRRSKVISGGGGKAKVLNLNVPMCIGYRHHLSCRSDENSAVGVSGGAAVNGGGNGGECQHDEGSGGNLFNLRNLFTKKSIVTSH